jgi:hypothetical protein
VNFATDYSRIETLELGGYGTLFALSAGLLLFADALAISAYPYMLAFSTTNKVSMDGGAGGKSVCDWRFLSSRAEWPTGRLATTRALFATIRGECLRNEAR